MTTTKPATINRFVVEYSGAAYESPAKVRVGDWIVAYFGRECPKVIITRVASLGAEYTGYCRQPLAIIRGGRLIEATK